MNIIYYELFDIIKNKNNEKKLPEVPVSLVSAIILSIIDKSAEMNCGVDSIFEVGRLVGEFLCPKNKEELVIMFENLGLGKLEFNEGCIVIKDDPLSKTINPKSHINYLSAGIISGALQTIDGKYYVIEEIKCDGPEETCEIKHSDKVCPYDKNITDIVFKVKNIE